MDLLWKIVSAVILALVEGVTEFLPVSSTGHMILVRELLDLDVPPLFAFAFGASLNVSSVAALDDGRWMPLPLISSATVRN